MTAQENVVIEITESNSTHCSANRPPSGYFVCPTLDHLNTFMKNISKNATVEIHIACTRCTLRELITFENISNLSIHGKDATTTILCQSMGHGSYNSGFVFKHASDLHLSNLIIFGCGGIHESTSKNVSGPNSKAFLHFKTALYFENCINVAITQIAVKNTSGIGLVFYNSRGMIKIRFSYFGNNFVPTNLENDFPGGGGVYIEFTPCIPGSNSGKSICVTNSDYNTGGHYVIQTCTFTLNSAYSARSYFKQSGFRTFGQGGGLLISLRGNASKNIFTIKNCSFTNNSALWGGGLHLFIANSSTENNITVSETRLEGNQANDGGGGVTIYISSPYSRREAPLSKNIILFERCNITKNSARQGGGMIVFFSIAYAKQRESNKLYFLNTIWDGNTAISSAAVDITAKDVSYTVHGPFPIFIDCKFLSNRVHSVTNLIKLLNGGLALQSNYGKASFLVTLAKIFFNDSVLFYENNATALYVSGGVVSFSSHITAKFEKNDGIKGGAIALIASSYLEVGRNSSLTFISNHAYVMGGAIYSYSIGEHELHEHILSLGCFIQHKHGSNLSNSQNQHSSINFTFADNDVVSFPHNNYGRAIFSASLLACASDYHGDFTILNASAALSYVANFIFVNSSAEEQVSMAGSKFDIQNGSLPSMVIPGKKLELQIAIIDALNNHVNTLLRSYVKPINNSRVAIDDSDTYIADNTLRIYGTPGARATIHLESIDYHTIDLSFDIQILQCPPGYILSKSHNERVTDQCVCAWNTDALYRGLTKCNNPHFQAYIVQGIWAGYSSESESEDTLFTAYCPLNFCSYNESKDLSYFYLLPAEPNRTTLSKFVCSTYRTGWLCGSCIDGYSVYFHSPNYRCGPNINCKLGLLLYLLSEIVPLIIIYTVIVVFKIQFTSGGLTGFILYAQILDALFLDVIDKSRATSQWSLTLKWAFLLTYRVLNLNFFTFDSLSFCLWKGATTFDIVAFKYTTVACAFILVLATYVIMNTCNVYRCHKYCIFYTHLPVQTSIIHGISTFLVMCFAQCVQISFLLLTPGRIYGKGGTIVQSRLLYHGDTTLYSTHHALYAIPAFICITVLVVLPTTLLLWYPSGPRLLSLCGLRDNGFCNKIIPLHKLKPFFDSFQGCFKDDYRFFSGLYFSYRLLTIAAYSFSIGLTQFYILVEVIFIIMLMLHALAQPYKKKCHNAIDTLVFTNLTIINALSIFIYTKSPEKLYNEMITAAVHIQTIFISLPLLVMMLLLMIYLVSKLKYLVARRWMNKPQHRSDSILSNGFPSRLVDSNSSDEGTDYNLLEEGTL
jgi:predicted outer membrane repeat protein